MNIDKELAIFLASEERPEGTMIYPELFGYVFSIACSPLKIAFDEWFPLIFDDNDPRFSSAEEERKIKNSVLLIYQEMSEKVALGNIALPSWCEILNPPMANFEEDAMLSHWARGMVEGHDWLGEVWKTYASPKQDGELSTCFMVLSYFSNKNLAQAYCDEYAHLFSSTLEDMAETVGDTFTHAMNSYARVGRTIAEQIAKMAQQKQQVGVSAASDALCPCGSGKLFKACCLH